MTRKRIARIAFEALLLAAAAALGAWLYWLKCVETVNTMQIPARTELYEVKEGMTATSISEELLGDAVPAFVVRFWIRRHPELQPIQRGHYRIDGKLTLKEILSLMVMGKVTETSFPTITIIEGSNIDDVERTMKRFCGSCDQALSELDVPAEFIISTLHSDPSLLGAIGGAASSLEGLLAPATYPVKSPRRINEALGQALRATAKMMKEEWPKRSDSVFIKTPYEALIVASIIERETAIPDERPQVAAVFYNRMRKRMRLQTDPTVMYGISPAFSGKLTKAQLKADTPYNTYTRAGLPPTPISMPSKSSVLAALHPADTDALYFVAADIDPSNGHVFTNTLKDHNKAVSDYRKKVSDYRQAQKDAAAAKDQQGKDSKGADQQSKPGAQAADQKPADKKAEDQKAADQKAGDQKAGDQKAADQKAVEQKAADQPKGQPYNQKPEDENAGKPDEDQAKAPQDQGNASSAASAENGSVKQDGAKDQGKDAGKGAKAGDEGASVKSTDGEVDVDISSGVSGDAAQDKAAAAEAGKPSAAQDGGAGGAEAKAGAASPAKGSDAKAGKSGQAKAGSSKKAGPKAQPKKAQSRKAQPRKQQQGTQNRKARQNKQQKKAA